MKHFDGIDQRIAAMDPVAFASLVDSLEKRKLLPKHDRGARLTAFVTPATHGSPPLESELQDHLSTRLPDYMQPSVWSVIDAMPKSANGKIDRAQLIARQRAALIQKSTENHGKAESVCVDSSNNIENELATVWQEVLGMDEVHVNDDYFELGGDSISAMQIVARCAKLELNFTTRELMQSSTIARLARRLSDKDRETEEAAKNNIDLENSDVDDVLRVLNLGRD